VGESDTHKRVEAMPALLASNGLLQQRARAASCAFLLQIGDQSFHGDLVDGALTLTPGPLLMRSWQFALRGDAQAWDSFWQPLPPPGFHDLFALTKAKRFVLEGDLTPFMRHLLFFKELFALPRALETRP